MTNSPTLMCEVCESEVAVGVAAMPGVPYSAAYGRRCLDANAHPYLILVANTALMAGGYPEADDDPLTRTADWWQEMVQNTLDHLQIEREEFDSDVTQALLDMQAEEAEQMRHPEEEP